MQQGRDVRQIAEANLAIFQGTDELSMGTPLKFRPYIGHIYIYGRDI